MLHHRFFLHGVSLLLVAMLAGCASQQATSSEPAQQPSPIPAPEVQQQVQTAFSLDEPSARYESVVRAIGAFLRDNSVRAMDEEAASLTLTEFAFASRNLTQPDPAVVRRSGALAVVGVPDGLGLVWYDLGGDQWLELSPWTVGLNRVEVVWHDDEAGVSYDTLGADGIRRPHYILVTREDAGWQVAWSSDEQPDWWFNNLDASITVAPDLSSVTTVGRTSSSPLAFDESDAHPRRSFRLEWARHEDRYTPGVPETAYSTRQEWAWAIAVPSPYTSLVEFVERLQRRDDAGAARLVADPGIVPAANAFGFYLISQPYEVILYEPDRITFRGYQGEFLATFQPPTTDGGPWLMTSLTPRGAEP